jgi:hypothetical protein
MIDEGRQRTTTSASGSETIDGVGISGCRRPKRTLTGQGANDSVSAILLKNAYEAVATPAGKVDRSESPIFNDH